MLSQDGVKIMKIVFSFNATRFSGRDYFEAGNLKVAPRGMELPMALKIPDALGQIETYNHNSHGGGETFDGLVCAESRQHALEILDAADLNAT